MNDNTRRRHERNGRARQFFIDNAGDFKNPPQKPLVDEIDLDWTTANAKQAEYEQKYGESRQEFQIKSDCREDLRDLMSRVAMAARSLVHLHPGINDLFRMPRGSVDQDLLAKARAFYTASANYEADMVAAGLDADFRDQLNAKADAFEASFGPAETAMDERIAALAEITDAVNKGAKAVRRLDGMVKLKYYGDPGKTAAWASASHVEAAPKKKDASTPPTP